MEDYLGASIVKSADVDALLAVPTPRCIGAAHLGGITVECKLKALLLAYHGVSKWDELGVRPKDPRKGQPIGNPGHALMAALRGMPELYRKAKADTTFLGHMSVVLNPLGSTGVDFIALRYASTPLGSSTMHAWRQ